MDEEETTALTNAKLSIILIGVGSAALVVSLYHCIISGWCNRLRTSHIHQQPPPVPPETSVPTGGGGGNGSVENSAVQLLPVHKYKKTGGLVQNDVLCAVCLCEFEEGEEIRTLPECMHSYHKLCIDMWLNSHSNCPICRTRAAPVTEQVFPANIHVDEVELEGIRDLSTLGLQTNRAPTLYVFRGLHDISIFC